MKGFQLSFMGFSICFSFRAFEFANNMIALVNVLSLLLSFVRISAFVSMKFLDVFILIWKKNCEQFHQNGVKTPSLALNHSIRITHSCNTFNTFFTDLNLTERAKSFTNGASFSFLHVYNDSLCDRFSFKF